MSTLNWISKNSVIRQEVPFRQRELVPEHSFGGTAMKDKCWGEVAV